MNIILIIIVGLIVGVGLYQLNPFGIQTIAQNMITPIAAFITANPIVSTIVAMAVPGLISIGLKIAYDSLKKSATEQIGNLSNVVVDKNTEIEATTNSYTQKIDSLTAELETLRNQPDNTTELTDLNTKLATDKKKLQNQIDALHELIM